MLLLADVMYEDTVSCQHVVLAQGHAGTIPMAIRRDPLAAAAEAITAIERQCQGGRLNVRADEAGDEEEQAASGSGTDASLVCTVGSILVWPGASNVIPGSANFSVDIRSASSHS